MVEIEKHQVVVLTSGGIDSSTTMLKLAVEGFTVFPLFIKCDLDVAFMEEGSIKSIICWMQKECALLRLYSSMFVVFFWFFRFVQGLFGCF